MSDIIISASKIWRRRCLHRHSASCNSMETYCWHFLSYIHTVRAKVPFVSLTTYVYVSSQQICHAVLIHFFFLTNQIDMCFVVTNRFVA